MEKAILINALEIVKPGLASKEVVEQSTSFAFYKDRVVTYNDQISISHPIEGLGVTGAIKADELYALLNKMKQKEIEIEENGNEIIIKAGRSKAGIRLQSEINLPLDEEVNQQGKFKTLPADFNTLLSFTLKACSNDMSQPLLTCVHVSEDKLEASDNHRIIQSTMEKKVPVKPFLIPAQSAKLVAKMHPIKISSGKGWVHFLTEKGTVISTRIFEEDFPKIGKHLNIKGAKITFPETLLQSLERANVFAHRDQSLDESVKIAIGKKNTTISSESEYGWFEEKIEMKHKGEGFTFSVTPYLLRDILTQTNTAVIKDSALEFKGANWVYLSMLKNE